MDSVLLVVLGSYSNISLPLVLLNTTVIFRGIRIFFYCSFFFFTPFNLFFFNPSPSLFSSLFRIWKFLSALMIISMFMLFYGVS